MIQLLNFMLKLLNIYLQSINYDARDVYSNDLRREVKDEFDAWLSVPETRQVNATSPIDPCTCMVEIARLAFSKNF